MKQGTDTEICQHCGLETPAIRTEEDFDLDVDEYLSRVNVLKPIIDNVFEENNIIGEFSGFEESADKLKVSAIAAATVAINMYLEWKERQERIKIPTKSGGHRYVRPVRSAERVYFAQDVNGGAIKIGYSANPLRRMEELGRISNLSLRVLATTAGNRTTEAELHRQFSHLRRSGEWFEPAPELLAHIERLLVE